jgi:nitrite reductase/ring-hydroxylating ferredoxin subunit/DMSO/TMAO reductase YedYZ heme-binding membrane subunit
MSVAYRAIGWNRQKRLYDLAMGSALLSGLVAYGITVHLYQPGTTIETFIIRFSSIAAIVLLHVILAIGPLTRLDRRFLPLLYNRRHLGVTTFLLALIHGAFAIVQFHAGGNRNPLVSVLTSYRREYLSFLSAPSQIAYFPFEALGLAALFIFFMMAATSHDFWLRNLGPSFWKTMHMLVYLAYALVVSHVFLGALQSERSLLFPATLGIGFAGLVILHLAAFAKEFKLDRTSPASGRDGFVFAAKCADLLPETGRVVVAGGKRIALLLREGRLFALSNVCRHQGGPLGEGRIVAGCLTCPWHGYQYRVDDGCSPPPFTEIVPTYEVRLSGEDIYVSTKALPLGTRSAGIPIEGRRERDAAGESDFYIGWQSKSAGRLSRYSRMFFAVVFAASSVLFFLAARFQNPIDPGTFEFGVERTFEGILMESPLPLLHVRGMQSGSGMNFLLVGSGKFGASQTVRGKDGHYIRFTGSLIHRNGVAMIEFSKPESLEVIGNTLEKLPQVISLGKSTLVGELVDTKCFLGVMRPATGKVHRGCAVRCLSGGAPPALLVRDEQGNSTAVLLAASNDKPLNIDWELAARSLEVQGSLEVHSGLPILRVHSWRLAQ